jgi:hypothetical protein
LAIWRRLAALSLQTVSARKHFANTALKSGGEGLVGKSGPNDGHEDFMQVGEALDGIGERLLVDLGVLGAEAIADGAVGEVANSTFITQLHGY